MNGEYLWGGVNGRKLRDGQSLIKSVAANFQSASELTTTTQLHENRVNKKRLPFFFLN